MPREDFEVTANLDFENMILYVKKSQVEHVYPLTPIKRSDLAKFREVNIPSFVLKYDGKLYWALFDKDISFFSKTIFGTHLCSTGRRTCARLFMSRSQPGYCMKTYSEDPRIENFPGITDGYQTFGTRYDCLVVTGCKYFTLHKV